MGARVVEVINSANDAAWFSTDTRGRPIDAAGAKFNTPDYLCIIYVDADIARDSLIGGTDGIAVLGANDLRGLSGEPIQPDSKGYIDDRPTAGDGDGRLRSLDRQLITSSS